MTYMSVNSCIYCTMHPYTHFHRFYNYWYSILSDYDITFVKSNRWKMDGPLNVLINGTTGNTEPIRCTADWHKERSSCTVKSDTDIGEFKCFTLDWDGAQPIYEDSFKFDLVSWSIKEIVIVGVLGSVLLVNTICVFYPESYIHTWAN